MKLKLSLTNTRAQDILEEIMKSKPTRKSLKQHLKECEGLVELEEWDRLIKYTNTSKKVSLIMKISLV